jgi:hypothetical protein
MAAEASNESEFVYADASITSTTHQEDLASLE